MTPDSLYKKSLRHQNATTPAKTASGLDWDTMNEALLFVAADEGGLQSGSGVIANAKLDNRTPTSCLLDPCRTSGVDGILQAVLTASPALCEQLLRWYETNATGGISTSSSTSSGGNPWIKVYTALGQDCRMLREGARVSMTPGRKQRKQLRDLLLSLRDRQLLQNMSKPSPAVVAASAARISQVDSDSAAVADRTAAAIEGGMRLQAAFGAVGAAGIGLGSESTNTASAPAARAGSASSSSTAATLVSNLAAGTPARMQAAALRRVAAASRVSSAADAGSVAGDNNVDDVTGPISTWPSVQGQPLRVKGILFRTYCAWEALQKPTDVQPPALKVQMAAETGAATLVGSSTASGSGSDVAVLPPAADSGTEDADTAIAAEELLDTIEESSSDDDGGSGDDSDSDADDDTGASSAAAGDANAGDGAAALSADNADAGSDDADNLELSQPPTKPTRIFKASEASGVGSHRALQAAGGGAADDDEDDLMLGSQNSLTRMSNQSAGGGKKRRKLSRDASVSSSSAPAAMTVPDPDTRPSSFPAPSARTDVPAAAASSSASAASADAAPAAAHTDAGRSSRKKKRKPSKLVLQGPEWCHNPVFDPITLISGHVNAAIAMIACCCASAAGTPSPIGRAAASEIVRRFLHDLLQHKGVTMEQDDDHGGDSDQAAFSSSAAAASASTPSKSRLGSATRPQPGSAASRGSKALSSAPPSAHRGAQSAARPRVTMDQYVRKSWETAAAEVRKMREVEAAEKARRQNDAAGAGAGSSSSSASSGAVADIMLPIEPSAPLTSAESTVARSRPHAAVVSEETLRSLTLRILGIFEYHALGRGGRGNQKASAASAAGGGGAVANFNAALSTLDASSTAGAQPSAISSSSSAAAGAASSSSSSPAVEAQAAATALPAHLQQQVLRYLKHVQAGLVSTGDVGVPGHGLPFLHPSNKLVERGEDQMLVYLQKVLVEPYWKVLQHAVYDVYQDLEVTKPPKQVREYGEGLVKALGSSRNALNAASTAGAGATVSSSLADAAAVPVPRDLRSSVAANASILAPVAPETIMPSVRPRLRDLLTRVVEPPSAASAQLDAGASSSSSSQQSMPSAAQSQASSSSSGLGADDNTRMSTASHSSRRGAAPSRSSAAAADAAAGAGSSDWDQDRTGSSVRSGRSGSGSVLQQQGSDSRSRGPTPTGGRGGGGGGSVASSASGPVGFTGVTSAATSLSRGIGAVAHTISAADPLLGAAAMIKSRRTTSSQMQPTLKLQGRVKTLKIDAGHSAAIVGNKK